ncbi:MFS transporter [Sorangium sp. So ce1128]
MLSTAPSDADATPLRPQEAATDRAAAPGGMRTFFLVWLGQVVSLVGSSLTGFALGVWLYQRTGSVTQLALVHCVTHLPSIVVLPLAGVLVDRWGRRQAMLLSDIGAAVGSLSILLLLAADRLTLWTIVPAVALASVMGALRLPAYSAATTVLVPARHLGRAAGMVQLGWGLAMLAAPLVAGLLLPLIELRGILMLDLCSFTIALLTLLVVRIPRPTPSAAPDAGRLPLLSGARYGLSVIRRHAGLRSLLLLATASTFCVAMAQMLSTPLILSFASATTLGLVLSLGGVGMLLGSAFMIVLGGPRRRVRGVLAFGALQGLMVLVVGLRPSVPLVTLGAFGFMFAAPLVASCNETLWQRAVAPDAQGRVFAIRNMALGAAMPLSSLVAGPLSDLVFEPLLAAGGPLSRSLGPYLGVGPGRGIGLLYVLLGVIAVIVSALGSLHRPLQRLEDDLAEGEPRTAPAALTS